MPKIHMETILKSPIVKDSGEEIEVEDELTTRVRERNAREPEKVLNEAKQVFQRLR